MEIFDIVDYEGNPTGETVTRAQAHEKGILHRTSHIWVIKNEPDSLKVLLQKRSMEKDSFPGQYDTSSAGHIQAGDEPLESALRELNEELGIKGKHVECVIVCWIPEILRSFKEKYPGIDIELSSCEGRSFG